MITYLLQNANIFMINKCKSICPIDKIAIDFPGMSFFGLYLGWFMWEQFIFLFHIGIYLAQFIRLGQTLKGTSVFLFELEEKIKFLFNCPAEL